MRVIISDAIILFSNLLIYLIIARAILSWFPEPRSGGIRQVYFAILRVAHILTEPLVGPIRNLIRRSPLGGPGMMLDFSPIIALLVINFARTILLSIVGIIFI